MSGSSEKSLLEKLGYMRGRVLLVQAPMSVEKLFGDLPKGLYIRKSGTGPFEAIHLFTKQKSDLAKRLPALLRLMKRDGMLWVSWPKKASGVATDLTEDEIRSVAIAAGLVDIKVCAVDDMWSGLKLVYRLRDR